MQVLVLSKLDYCNSLLLGSNQYIITKLQVQNMACHVIYNLKWSLSITPYMRDLHWLKIPEYIKYKAAVYIYKCVHETAPKYLQDRIQVQAELTPDQRTLRLHITGKLPTSRSNLTQVHCWSFSSMGQRIWNDLPFNMRMSQDINTFKKNIKTCLFKKIIPLLVDNKTTDNYQCILVVPGSPRLCSCGTIIYTFLLNFTLFLIVLYYQCLPVKCPRKDIVCVYWTVYKINYYYLC